VLYTAFLERITIRRPPASDWVCIAFLFIVNLISALNSKGFEFGRTCLGVNLITRVDYNSPAAFSDKFDVGDEILEVFVLEMGNPNRREGKANPSHIPIPD
jgi:hypothetical protein